MSLEIFSKNFKKISKMRIYNNEKFKSSFFYQKNNINKLTTHLVNTFSKNFFSSASNKKIKENVFNEKNIMKNIKINDIKPIYFMKIPYYKFFSTQNKEKKKKVNLIFLNGKKETHVEAEIGKNILEIAHENEVELEGACEASLACSTCHIILEQNVYDILPSAKEEEDDLLDLAFGISHTSRLGCQVIITEEFEGTKITIPSATRNLYVDGHKPKPH